MLPLGGPNVTGANVPLEYAALLEEDPLAGAGGITICVIPRSTRPDTQLNRSAILKTTKWYMARTVMKDVNESVNFRCLNFLSSWRNGGCGCGTVLDPLTMNQTREWWRIV